MEILWRILCVRVKVENSVLSQENEDVTVESLVQDLLKKMETLESHLVDYQNKVKSAIVTE